MRFPAAFGALLSEPRRDGRRYMGADRAVLGFAICSLGLQNGVERITKAHDDARLLVLIARAGRA